MRALVDADIFAYEFGNFKDLDTGDLLPWEIVRSLVDERIRDILETVEATEASYYLTDSKSNFRNEVATILPYKGHRPSDKPPHWANIRQHLVDNYDAEICYGIEADDKCGIEQSKGYKEAVDYVDTQQVFKFIPYLKEHLLNEDEGTIICSRDKDLRMIPGWHYVWPCGKQKEEKFFVTEEEGIRFFYKQLLTGDATDNILGLYGVGAKSSLVTQLNDMDDEYDMYCHVFSKYKDRFGSHAYKFLVENATLLWIRREEDSEALYTRLDRHEDMRRST